MFVAQVSSQTELLAAASAMDFFIEVLSDFEKKSEFQWNYISYHQWRRDLFF